jgi:hypothetical protein
LHEAKIVTVTGKLAAGVRPHINFSNVRYTSPILAGSPARIGKKGKKGKKPRIYYEPPDIRVVKAFFSDGTADNNA